MREFIGHGFGWLGAGFGVRSPGCCAPVQYSAGPDAVISREVLR
jgi:hypothetical protein